jgi:hypothetical protein
VGEVFFQMSMGLGKRDHYFRARWIVQNKFVFGHNSKKEYTIRIRLTLQVAHHVESKVDIKVQHIEFDRVGKGQEPDHIRGTDMEPHCDLIRPQMVAIVIVSCSWPFPLLLFDLIIGLECWWSTEGVDMARWRQWAIRRTINIPNGDYPKTKGSTPAALIQTHGRWNFGHPINEM